MALNAFEHLLLCRHPSVLQRGNGQEHGAAEHSQAGPDEFKQANQKAA